MKTLINYVVQDAREHSHLSEILEISSPPYTFSSDPPVSEVMKWMEKKQNELFEGQKLIIMSMYKI
jgi:hypothetical protein